MKEYTTRWESYVAEAGSDPVSGLTGKEAEQRLLQYGENLLEQKRRQSAVQRFFHQLKDPMVIILIAAALISFVVALVEGGEFIDSVIIVAIVVLNGVLGVVQESRAERSLEALQKMSAPTAKVVREGTVARIPSTSLVPGDLVVLEAGDLVPADLRLVESASLMCEESALTGESVPVEKDASVVVRPGAPLGDRRNMAFSGCSVSYGRGRGVVSATGMKTEMGKIAGLLNQTGTALTPLQVKLGALGKKLGILALAVCGVILVLGLLQGMALLDIFMIAVSLAVAAIPEGLTMVVTVVLALGVQRMVKKNAIVRSLPAVETLGSASVICSDKTGTLTQNRMTVQKVWAADQEMEDVGGGLSAQALQVLRLGTLCSDARVEEVDGRRRDMGDPTETAIVAAALDQGIAKESLEEAFPRIGEIPFDSQRKLMTTVHRGDGKVLAVVKGGFDVLLPRCRGENIRKAPEINRQMGEEALRVLAVAYRELAEEPEAYTSQALEEDLIFAGLMGMMDPPREESRDAVAVCKKAGIRTVMITGDHVVTASAIARELGILEEGDGAISGEELANMSQPQLKAHVQEYSVYARVSPEDKIRIVQAWQSQGAVVSMTGDGVNDAPALRAADIGCAMGITGTDVAKGAADMVLTDDNFSTIVAAVKEGRGIYDNIRKVIQFLLSSNLGEVFTVFFAMVLGWGAPLLAIHLLLINVVTDALPALALGVEPVSEEIMHRPPLPKNQGVFAGGMGIVIVLQGVLVSVLTLAGYYIGRNVALSPFFVPGHEIGMTMAFLVLALSQLTQAFNCRSSRSLFQIGLFTNRVLAYSAAISALIVMGLCLIPPLETLFQLTDISMLHWLWVLGLSLVPLAAAEAGKLALRIYRKRAVAK